MNATFKTAHDGTISRDCSQDGSNTLNTTVQYELQGVAELLLAKE